MLLILPFAGTAVSVINEVETLIQESNEQNHQNHLRNFDRPMWSWSLNFWRQSFCPTAVMDDVRRLDYNRRHWRNTDMAWLFNRAWSQR